MPLLRCSIEMAMVISPSKRPNKPARSSCSDSLLRPWLTARYREFHREQLSIEHSMRDLDSAVGRLDDLFMSVYVVVAILIIAVTLVGPPFRIEINVDQTFLSRKPNLLP
jgi:hypothetical protein